MKIAAYLVLTIALIVGFYSLRKVDDRISFTDFKWSLNGKTAPISFHVKNRTNTPMDIVVVATAEVISNDDVGTKPRPVGHLKVEVALAPREAKKVERVIQLTEFGNSATVVSHYVAIRDQTDAK
jgi:hypothetical protein